MSIKMETSFVVLAVLIGAIFVVPFCESLEVVGPCRTPPVVNQFDVAQYMGTWYEVKRYETVNQPGGDCVTAKYTLNTAPVQVTVENTLKLLPSLEPVVANGRAVLASTTDEAKLKVRFDETPQTVPDSDYWVLATNYQQYAVVWSCRENAANSIESAWVLSRTPVLDAAAEALVNNVVTTQLRSDAFRTTKQGDEYCSSATTASISFLLLALLLVLRLC